MHGLVTASFRFYLRQPWQLLLCLLGIALGVAVVVAMDVTINSAQRGFQLSNAAVFGAATHSLDAGQMGFDEALYLQLRTRLRRIPSAPVVSGSGVYPRQSGPGLQLRLVGIDPFAEGAFRSYAGYSQMAQEPNQGLNAFLTEPGAVLATPATVNKLGVRIGDWIKIQIAGHVRRLHIVGEIKPRNRLQRLGLENVLIADIATAQELLGSVGRLSRIDVILQGGDAGRHDEAALKALLPEGVRLRTRAVRQQAVEQLTRSFYLNLRMLSLLALVVGLFIVYNAMTFSVVQRREWLGYLRAVGVTGREILILVMIEALLLGIAGTLLGAPVGVGLAQLLLMLVTRTLDDLYFSTQVQQLVLSVESLPALLLPGVFGSLLAALLPALEATRISPRAATLRSGLERRVKRLSGVLAGVAAGLALLIPTILWWWPRSLMAGYCALFLTVIGFACLAPGAISIFSMAMARLLRNSRAHLCRIALSAVRQGLSRNATAVIALMIALSASVGVGVMVESFRLTLEAWLTTTLQADIYIAVDGRRLSDPIDPDLVQAISKLPGIEAVTTSRDIDVITERGEVWLKSLNARASRPFRGLSFVNADPGQAWQALTKENTVIISESFAWRHQLKVKDNLRITTLDGVRPFKVIAVFRDYGSERGMLIMDERAFHTHWRDQSITDIGLYLSPGQPMQAVLDSVQRLAVGTQRLKLFANRDIRKLSLEIFDRTFAVTQVLKWLAILVAVAGILSALAALQLEQRRQMFVLRAQGLTRRELFAIQELQTGYLGLLAGLLAMPLGLILAVLLIRVINQRAFGWSLDFYLNPEIFAQSMLIALLSALAAGLYPAWKLSRELRMGSGLSL